MTTMAYNVPKNEQQYKALCAEANVTLPWAEKTDVLRTPLNVGDKIAPNRIAYQPMEGCDGTSDGRPDELTLRRYDRFAKGGAGIVWAEAMAVLQEGRANPRQLYINENTADDFARLVERIKTTCLKENGYEPLVIAQLTHSGRYSKPEGKPAPLIAYHCATLEASNPIDDSRIVTDDYLETVQQKLIEGALLAEKCGFDGADIKCCHRYLLCELLSAYTREGKFGGSFENRTRLFRTAVAESVRLCGDDFLITSRMNLYDGYPRPDGFGVRDDGTTDPDMTEAIALCQALRDSGVKLLDFTMGNPYFNPHVNRPYTRGGYEAPEHPMVGCERMLRGTAEVAKAIPEVAVISSAMTFMGAAAPHVAAACIEQGWFAFAGFGRQTLAYPDLAVDICKTGGLCDKKLCLACSKCTEIMRKPGGTPGCVVRDAEVYAPIYKELVQK